MREGVHAVPPAITSSGERGVKTSALSRWRFNEAGKANTDPMNDDIEDPRADPYATARLLRRRSTEAERALWHCVRAKRLAGRKFRRQHPIGPYFADFACIEAGLVVELDGGQHFDADVAAYDARRTAVLRKLGFQVMRFTNSEALLQRDEVRERILKWLLARDAG